MERYYVIFIGQVQGVGFRNRVRFLAEQYGLTGFVQNLWTGNVSAEIQGEQQQIDLFMREVIKPYYYIRVKDYSMKRIKVKKEKTFNVI